MGSNPERKWCATQIAQLSGHKSLKSIENYTSAQNNRCICQIYWVTFQVIVQESLHSLRLQLRHFRWIFRPDGTSCMSLQLPWPTVYDFIPGCSHSWRTVLCNHQHNESITTAPFSLRKASVEENQSIQRLRWWLSYVHWTFALNFHESCRLFWLISGKVCIVLFSVKAYDAHMFSWFSDILIYDIYDL